MKKFSELTTNCKVYGFKLEAGSIIDDYAFKFAYKDAIDRHRYVFECVKCGEVKEVSKHTIKCRKQVKTFRHDKETPCCKVSACNKSTI